MAINLITKAISTMKYSLQLSRITILYLFLIPMLSCTMAQEHPKNSLNLDKSIRTGHLPNGFTYYLKPTSDTNKINLRFYVKVGALNGNQLKTEQYAHLLEHFGYIEGYVKSYLQNDATFKKSGSTTFAGTSGIYTPYWSSVQDDDSLALMDRLQWFYNISNMELEDSLIIREARCVRQEVFYKAEGFGLNKRINKSLRDAAIFFDADGETPYTNWLTNYDMGGISIDSVREFQRSWYRPDRMGLMITGNIQDMDSLEQRLITLYSKIPKAAGEGGNFDRRIFYHSAPRRFKTVPRIELNRISTWNNKNSKISFFYRVKKFDPVLDTKEKWLNEQLYMAIYGMIYSRLREKGVPSWTIKKGGIIDIKFPDRDHPYLRLPEIENTLGTEQENIQRVASILKQLQKNGFTKQEWDERKQVLLKGISSKDTASTAFWEDQLEKHFVYNEILPAQKKAMTQGWIDNLSLGDINSYLQNNFSVMPDDIYITASAGHPALSYTEDQVRGWINEAIKNPIELKEIINISSLTPLDEKNSALMSEKEVEELKEGGYQKVEVDPDTGLEVLQLDNGVKLLLDNKETDKNSSEMISISGTSPNGASCFPKAHYYAAISAPEIVKLGGAGGFSRETIKRKLGKEFQFNTEPVQLQIQQNSSTVSTRASLKDLEEYLQLVYWYFTAPRKDSLAFKKWKSNIKEHYFSKSPKGVSPKTDMTDAIATLLNFEAYRPPHNPISTQQYHQTQHLDYEQAMSCYRAIFGNASKFTFTVRGSYKKEQVLPLLQKYLGNLPSNSNILCPTNENDVTLPKGPIYHTFYADKMKIGYTLYTLPYILTYIFPIVEENWKDRVVMDILNIDVQSKVGSELRFIKGASVYHETIEGRYSKVDELYSLTIHVDALDDEFEWIRSECKTIINEIKNRGLDTETKNLILQDPLFIGRYASDPKLKEKVMQYARSLTAEDIKKVAAKYLVERHQYEFVLRNQKENEIVP
ncbi:insulinase family protein [Galbibacter orientalis]|uniref:insulinase family protein n=1 Tax=Galbibacter orientalis TaxID=453852 RepID=UPI003080FE23